jgi:branched-chain amino acid transport system substrate-binding protein
MRTRLSSLLAISVLVAACGGAATPSAAPASGGGGGTGDLTLGAVIPLSGGQASYGEMAKGGLDLAVKEINDAGGVNGRQVVIEFEDNQGVPANSATAAQTLMGKGINKIFTHGSSVTAAIYNVTKDSDILLANMAAQSDAVIGASPQVYSFLPTNGMELGHLAELAYTKLGLKKLAIQSSDDDYGKSASKAVIDAYTALGGEVVAHEVHAPGTVDMRTQLIKIGDADPDALAVLANTGEIGQVFKQAKELGIDATLMGADSALSPSEIETAGEAMEGATGVAIRFDPTRSDAAAKFAADFEAANGKAPNNYAAISYEAARNVLAGIAAGNEDPGPLGEYLLGVQGYDSILGEMSFNENRIVEFPYYEWKFTGGEITPLE